MRVGLGAEKGNGMRACVPKGLGQGKQAKEVMDRLRGRAGALCCGGKRGAMEGGGEAAGNKLRFAPSKRAAAAAFKTGRVCSPFSILFCVLENQTHRHTSMGGTSKDISVRGC